MMDIFHYSFMIRALLAGLAIGVVAPLIGTFLVAKRYSLIADSLAHVSVAGVAAGVLVGVNPLLGALVVAVAAAYVIEQLRAAQRLTAEVALAMFLSSGLAIAVVLIGMSKKVNLDLFSFLFGSITTVSAQDLWIIGALATLILAVVMYGYKQLAYVAFDEAQAKVSGLHTRLINQTLMFLAAVMVVSSLRIVGGLLIGALTVMPVAAASQVAKSLRQTMFLAVGFGLVAVLIGLALSFYLSLAAGGTIVLTALALFLLSLVVRKFQR
jgi:zinc transport system permease protein